MLESLKHLFVRRQKPPYQAGTNLLLVLVLSVLVGAGVSYGTIGFMKAFESVVNWVYFDWSDSPSGRYSHKEDGHTSSPKKLSFDFRGADEGGLGSLKKTQWDSNGTCRIVATGSDGARPE